MHILPTYNMYLLRKEKERIKATEKSFEKLRRYKAPSKSETETKKGIKPPLEPEGNKSEGLKISDIECYDCGKNLLHKNNTWPVLCQPNRSA